MPKDNQSEQECAKRRAVEVASQSPQSTPKVNTSCVPVKLEEGDAGGDVPLTAAVNVKLEEGGARGRPGGTLLAAGGMGEDAFPAYKIR